MSAPPKDLLPSGFAVIRSVGDLCRHDGRVWRWDGEDWRAVEPLTVSEGCPECVEPDEDPAPWCDCLPSHGDEPCKRVPCKQRAHSPEHCPRPYLRCARCNYDEHTCPGCGEPLKHGVEECSDCAVMM